LKNYIVLSCLAALMAGAQEKNTNQAQVSSVVLRGAATSSGCAVPCSYNPADVEVLGDLQYGQTSNLVPYSPTPPYRAFVFSAFGGEKVEVTVKGADRKAFVALADSSLNQLTSGATNLSLALPYRGPDIEVWYIVFRDLDNKPGRFTVQVKKVASAPR
jgi:hypothetical protein